ncbi:YeiH family protein [Zhihengliuella flava]|uniref:Integral membrane protein (TIGR00698 family) n=1 Tax=Zhihengliuella flava TaxID=1285193 RepID=A0A931D8V6_9MICC|nr:putative integral membrane protein (TIGR00698 family) [Zhihengliuella flava]
MSDSPGRASWGRRVRAVVPGLVAAGAAVGLSVLAHLGLPALPVMTLCVALGALAGNVLRAPVRAGHPLRRAESALRPGLSFAGRTLMRAGIVLLGLALVPADLAALGFDGVAVVAAAVGAAFVGTWAAARLFRLPGDEPVLLAAGFSICGASAIGAMSQARGTTRDASTPIALVTLCGTLSIAVLPLLAGWLGLGPLTFGYWAGAAVHDVGQVVATAQTAGAAALAAAVVVKLVRVLTLAPVTTVGAWTARRRAARHGTDGARQPGRRAPLVPLFVIGFALMVAARATGLVAPEALALAHLAQEALLGAALFGLGFAIDLRALFASASRSTGAALVAWAWIALLGLGVAAILSNGSFMV